MKSWIGHILHVIYKTPIALDADTDVSTAIEQLTKAYCNMHRVDLNSGEAILIHSAVCTVVETTAIQKSINAYFKNAYTKAILNDVIGNVFERQQNEIDKALNSKSPLEELAEKVSESNEKTLIGLINSIMENAKAAKDLIGEN